MWPKNRNWVNIEVWKKNRFIATLSALLTLTWMMLMILLIPTGVYWKKKKEEEGVNVLKYSASISQIPHQVLAMLLWLHLVIFPLWEANWISVNQQTLISVSAFWWSSSFCLLSVHFRLWEDLTCKKNKQQWPSWHGEINTPVALRPPSC